MLNGFKRSYKGRIVDEVYTRLGQTDYQASSRSCARRTPGGVRVYPGGMGSRSSGSIRRRACAGSSRCTRCITVDEISITALKHAALGQYETRYWSPDLKNPANQKYVSDYRKKFARCRCFYGAQSYDGILLIDSAVRAVKGNLSNKKGWLRR